MNTPELVEFAQEILKQRFELPLRLQTTQRRVHMGLIKFISSRGRADESQWTFKSNVFMVFRLFTNTDSNPAIL